MPYRRRQPEMVTWHSQLIFLLVALVWGLSYLMPPHNRIPFAEVFPDIIERTVGSSSMWIWGLGLFVPALIGWVGDLMLRFTHLLWSWHFSLVAHFVLTGVYATLTVTALVEGLQQASHYPWPSCLIEAIISALSRPLLWGAITYVHWTYARLPAPAKPVLVAKEPEEWIPTQSSTH